MLNLDDERWKSLSGGYRTKFDPRPLLSKLESGEDATVAWHDLWERLHHQGDVGEASYAAVPHLVRIHRQRGVVDWNTYGLVAVIELARTEMQNPPIPDWLEKDYFRAIRELAEIGSVEFWRGTNPEEIRAILSILALARDARITARFLLEYSEEELLEMEKCIREAETSS
jgi:hypothetical protein